MDPRLTRRWSARRGRLSTSEQAELAADFAQDHGLATRLGRAEFTASRSRDTARFRLPASFQPTWGARIGERRAKCESLDGAGRM